MEVARATLPLSKDRQSVILSYYLMHRVSVKKGVTYLFLIYDVKVIAVFCTIQNAYACQTSTCSKIPLGTQNYITKAAKTAAATKTD